MTQQENKKMRTLAQFLKKSMAKEIQFVEVAFKLSKQQKRSLSLFCKHHGITSIKLIKRSIERYINYIPEKDAKPYVHPRQLNIWDDTELSVEHYKKYLPLHKPKI